MIQADVRQLVDDGAIFYVSHSGGKDSQAMYAHVRTIVPDEQIIVVHADLGEIEWKGVDDHIRATTLHPLNIVRARKTFFQMVRERALNRPDVPSFPASTTRQCTSDLKRGPIYKFIRRDMNRRGSRLGVNTMGLRAEESTSRKRLTDLAVNDTLTNGKRTVYNWLPIHRLKEQEVFHRIAQAGQTPFLRSRQPPPVVRVLHPRLRGRPRQRAQAPARPLREVHEARGRDGMDDVLPGIAQGTRRQGRSRRRARRPSGLTQPATAACRACSASSPARATSPTGASTGPTSSRSTRSSRKRRDGRCSPGNRSRHAPTRPTTAAPKRPTRRRACRSRDSRTENPKDHAERTGPEGPHP